MPDEILIVDDSPINLRLLTFLMRSKGYAVRTAVDAPTARLAIEERPPALILMDVQLPGMDGLELTRELKAAPATQSIPVIVVTASAMRGDEIKARHAGCDAYVTKPINTQLVPALVAQLLAKAREGTP
jgi:CheY-like chemotaxis protein